MSTSSAINRGLAATKATREDDSRGRRRPGRHIEGPKAERGLRKRQEDHLSSSFQPVSTAWETAWKPQARTHKQLLSRSPRTTKRRGEKTQPQQTEEKQDQVNNEDNDIPVRVPYSTAASNFIYGSNAVLAALRARRRKFYRLYLHRRVSGEEGNARSIVDLARKYDVRTTSNADLRLLDRMSECRPHNGVVLEASHLPAPPLLSLARPQRRTSSVPLVLDRQSAEDVAVNGAPDALRTLTQSWRHPFILMLDGITDPGNVGNILRTAHFYGVDAVAIAKNTCASLTSAPLAKASSGACEALRIFTLPRPSDFIYDSAKAGWHLYAAVAPRYQRPHELRRPRDYVRNLTTSAVAQSSPLAEHPIILMLGAEGEGLRDNLKNKADHFVTIEQGRRAFDAEDKENVDIGVDSLNVGAAAGVLVEAFMRKPEGSGELRNAGDLGF